MSITIDRSVAVAPSLQEDLHFPTALSLHALQPAGARHCDGALEHCSWDDAMPTLKDLTACPMLLQSAAVERPDRSHLFFVLRQTLAALLTGGRGHLDHEAGLLPA